MIELEKPETARKCERCGKGGSFYGLMTFNGKRGYWHRKCFTAAQKDIEMRAFRAPQKANT